MELQLLLMMLACNVGPALAIIENKRPIHNISAAMLIPAAMRDDSTKRYLCMYPLGPLNEECTTGFTAMNKTVLVDKTIAGSAPISEPFVGFTAVNKTVLHNKAIAGSAPTPEPFVPSTAKPEPFMFTRFELSMYLEYNFWGVPKDQHDMVACFQGGRDKDSRENCQRFAMDTVPRQGDGWNAWYRFEFPGVKNAVYELHCGNWCYKINAGRGKMDNLWMRFNGDLKNVPTQCKAEHVYREWQSPMQVKAQIYRWEKVTCAWEGLEYEASVDEVK